MPGSQASEDRGSDGEYKKQDSKASLQSKHTEPDTRTPAADRGGGGGTGFGGGEGGGQQWSKNFNILIIVNLALSLLLLIIIVATPSWVVGKRPKDAEGNEAMLQGGGVFSITGCSESPVGAGICAVLCLILMIVMLLVQVGHWKKEGEIAILPKLQMGLAHFLWLMLMISWVIVAAWRNSGGSCDGRPASDLFFYNWGWCFVLFMWLVWLLLAVLITLKVAGKTLPFNL